MQFSVDPQVIVDAGADGGIVRKRGYLRKRVAYRKKNAVNLQVFIFCPYNIDGKHLSSGDAVEDLAGYQLFIDNWYWGRSKAGYRQTEGMDTE